MKNLHVQFNKTENINFFFISFSEEKKKEKRKTLEKHENVCIRTYKKNTYEKLFFQQQLNKNEIFLACK